MLATECLAQVTALQAEHRELQEAPRQEGDEYDACRTAVQEAFTAIDLSSDGPENLTATLSCLPAFVQSGKQDALFRGIQWTFTASPAH